MLKALYFSGTKEDVEKYLRHLTDGRRVTVTHFEDEIACQHVCSGNCRREGCNCECGEWHLSGEELANHHD